MKPLRSLALGPLLGASLCLAGAAPAADDKPKAKPAGASAMTAKPATARKGRPVSPADQKAIIALFKDVDPSKYHLEFNRGKTKVGNRKVSMQELEQVKTVTNPGEAAGYIVLATRDDGVMFMLAVTGKDELVQALGAEKMAKLNQIMGKYSRAGM